MPVSEEGREAISIVMPAHNEAGYLETAVREVVDGLRARRRPFELLVVENGSVDGTHALAQRLATDYPEVRVRSYPVADYGAALRTGLLTARHPLAVTFDVDYYDVGFLDAAVELVHRDREHRPVIVVGSKRAPGAHDERPWPRRLVTAVFAAILKAAFGLHVSDTHGMKLVRGDALAPIIERCRFGTDLFDTELVIRAERAGLETAELPVSVRERRPSRTPIWRRVPRTLLGLARLRVALAREHRR